MFWKLTTKLFIEVKITQNTKEIWEGLKEKKKKQVNGVGEDANSENMKAEFYWTKWNSNVKPLKSPPKQK